MNSMNFGAAIEAIKAGKRIARTGWNGKGMFVYLVPPASYPVQTGAAKAHFGEGAMVPYNAYMAIKNVDDTVSTWAPSVNDCLATDWGVVGESEQKANSTVTDGLEREIQAKASNGPRVTPQAVKDEIVSEWYINGATAVVPDDFQPPVSHDSPLNLLTICVLQLRNGYTVHGVSACASPENFNAEIGRRIARENAEREIWPLLGFRLRDQLAYANFVATN
jgi:hypothetical protein